jgi:thermitase
VKSQQVDIGQLATSPPAEPSLEPPSAPGSLQASANSSGIVSLGWHDNSDKETGFQLERQKWRSKGNRWISSALLSTVSADTTTGSDAPGTGTFRYRVQAYNDAGSSAWSSWVTVDVTASGGGSDGGGGGSTKPCRGKKCR